MGKKHTVLIADSDVLNLNTLGNMLTEMGYTALLADSIDVLFNYLDEEFPALVLLNSEMKTDDGQSVMHNLKKAVKYSNVPTVSVVSKDAIQNIDLIFDSGAVDYVLKPFSHQELEIKLKTHIELKTYNDTLLRLGRNITRAYDELVTAQSIVNTKNSELNLFINELDKASKTDFLTGLYNRRHMLDKLNDEVVRARSTGRTCAVLMGDLDRFKLVNDTYGHDCGDEVLKTVSKLFKSMVREHDSVARWGGEEFLLLIVEINKEDARAFGERIRSKVENTPIYYNGNRIDITMTLGVSLLKGDYDTASDIIMRADSALYAGKNSGRNKVVVQ